VRPPAPKAGALPAAPRPDFLNRALLTPDPVKRFTLVFDVHQIAEKAGTICLGSHLSETINFRNGNAHFRFIIKRLKNDTIALSKFDEGFDLVMRSVSIE